MHTRQELDTFYTVYARYFAAHSSLRSAGPGRVATMDEIRAYVEVMGGAEQVGWTPRRVTLSDGQTAYVGERGAGQ
jgi:hypothetical protein